MPICHGLYGHRDGFESRPVRKKAFDRKAFLFFMAYFVYIIKSVVDGTYYKGSTQNPIVRLGQHNEGLSHYTAAKRPWVLVYVEELPDKKSMLIREKKLKRGNKAYFEKLIEGNKNIANQFRLE